MDPFASALELAAAIRRRELSPREVVDVYLERIDRLNPELGAIVWRRDDELRREADEAEDALAAGEDVGPFHGVPMPIKDLTDVAGWPTTFGSRGAAARVADVTSTVVERFRDAGFLLMARTNTPEFGTVSVTENSLFGATRNPWNPDHTPGGSSGGASAAVAAGLAPIAHANDGGGSIRMPASCAGLVGLKPSRGRVSSGPVACDVMHGGAVEGCVSRTVADTAAVLDAVSAFDPHAWYNAPAPVRPFLEETHEDPRRLRIAFTTRAPTGGPVDRECVTAVENAARLLDGLGHEVFEGAPAWPDESEFVPAFLVVWNTGSAYWDVDDWDAIEPLNAELRRQAAAMSSLDYVAGVLRLQALSRQLVAAWGRDFDVLMTPTVAVLPPKVGYLFEGVDDPMVSIGRAAEMAPFTAMFNVSGQPAVSLPLHRSDGGLPVGVQLVGKPWGEAELLRLSAQIERAAPWRDARPPLV